MSIGPTDLMNGDTRKTRRISSVRKPTTIGRRLPPEQLHQIGHGTFHP
jgi:hypothetical protein